MEVTPGFCLIFCVLISSGICGEDSTKVTAAATPTALVSTGSTGSGSNSTVKSPTVKKELVYHKPGNGRDQRFAFNIPLISGSNINPPGTVSSTQTPYPNNYDQNYNNGIGGGGIGDGGFGAAGLGVASTLALVKGGVLGGLTALKAAVLPPLFIGAVIIFLIAGAAFFTCSVVNCGNLLNLGGLGSGGGGGSPFNNFANFFNRNGFEPSPYYGGNDYYYNYENQVQPVYQALEEAYKKYGGSGSWASSGSGINSGDLKLNQVNK